MRYQEVVPISRPDAEAAFASDDVERTCDALVRLAFHDDDRHFVQEHCLRLATDPRWELREIALTCLGHVARIHGAIDRERVVPVVMALVDDPKVGGTAETVLEDFEIFLVARRPERLRNAQHVTAYTENDVSYPRIRYGDEDPRWGEIPCRDCGTTKGLFHGLDCEYERCPKCGDGSGGGHACEFDELFDPNEAVVEQWSSRCAAGWSRGSALLFLGAVLALLRAAP